MNQLPERQSNSKEGLKTNPGHLESNIQQTNLQGTPSFQSNKYVEQMNASKMQTKNDLDYIGDNDKMGDDFKMKTSNQAPGSKNPLDHGIA